MSRERKLRTYVVVFLRLCGSVGLAGDRLYPAPPERKEVWERASTSPGKPSEVLPPTPNQICLRCPPNLAFPRMIFDIAFFGGESD